MPPRLPSAWTVAALAGLLGLGLGVGTAAIEAIARPMRVGDFSAPTFGGGAAASGGPKAVIESAEHDFGSMGSGQSGRHRFYITNAGDAPLKLSRGQSSCGCTIAEVGREEIAAGATGEVTVEWRTKGEGGPFRQQVIVHTNDPRRPDVSLRIMGSVVPTWRAIPPSVVFPKLGASERQTATVTLLTYSQPPPVLERISLMEPATADFFTVESRGLGKEELADVGDPQVTGGLLVTIESLPGLPLGQLRQTVQVKLRSPDGTGSAGAGNGGEGGEGRGIAGAQEGREVRPTPGPTSINEATGEIIAEIPVEGVVTGDLAVAGRAWDSTSQSVVLGSVSSRTGLRTEVFLTVKGPNRESVRPKLEEVVPSSMKVDIGASKPVGTGTVRRVPITVTIPAGSPTCNHLGTKQAPPGRIVLSTGHPDMPLMEIPVRVSIEP
jgi:hypothetical protein